MQTANRPLGSRCLGLGALLALLGPVRATAAPEPVPPSSPLVFPQEEPAPERTGIRWASAATFAGGAATAFAIHESCHLVADLAFGNLPRLESVKFLGFVPFFAISPGISCVGGRCTHRDGEPFGPGPRGLYTIVSAGFQCQHLGDEIILTREPNLRLTEAPFRKGMLAFNTLASIGYALANWLSLEPAAGDLRAMGRLSPIPQVVSLLVFAAAALDLWRYFSPDAVWLPWASRISKIATTGMVFTL